MRIRLMLATIATALVGVLAAPSMAAAAPQPIIGGSVVPAGAAPWAVAVYQNGSFACSGSLIAPTWVLTARHCIGGTMTVRYGSQNYNGGAVYSVVQTFANFDVALLRLGTAVASPSVVTLATANPPVGASTTIFGWGRTCTSCAPSIPLKTATATVTTLAATDAYGGPAIRSGPGNGVAWQGDSGGPQFYNGRQVGVCSTGNGSTLQNYSSIANSRAWITSVSGV